MPTSAFQTTNFIGDLDALKKIGEEASDQVRAVFERTDVLGDFT